MLSCLIIIRIYNICPGSQYIGSWSHLRKKQFYLKFKIFPVGIKFEIWNKIWKFWHVVVTCAELWSGQCKACCLPASPAPRNQNKCPTLFSYLFFLNCISPDTFQLYILKPGHKRCLHIWFISWKQFKSHFQAGKIKGEDCIVSLISLGDRPIHRNRLTAVLPVFILFPFSIISYKI